MFIPTHQKIRDKPLAGPIKHCLQMDRSVLPLDPRHLEVLAGVPKMISEPIARLAQTVPLSCINISTISKQTETSFYLTQVT
jgi:hypothetical protein